jgi:hypothetical protein
VLLNGGESNGDFGFSPVCFKVILGATTSYSPASMDRRMLKKSVAGKEYRYWL